MFRTFALSAAVLMGSLGLQAEGDLKTLRFGIIATESTDNLKATWGEFINAMEEGTGYKVEPFFAPDYAGVIEAMGADKIEFAWFGNKSAMEAVDRSGGEIFAQTTDVEGNPGYWSLIIVHKDSPYNSVDDVIANANKLNFANGDPNSTSGFLIPSFYIWARRNLDPNSIFKSVTNAGHEANALSVANKKADVATNNTESMRRLQSSNPTAAESLKVIWKSPLIPNDPFVMRSNLPDVTKEKLRAWILGFGRIGTEAEVQKARDILSRTSSGLGVFNYSSNHQLVPIRQLALVKNKISLENDSTLSASAKQAQLKEVEQQLADLELFKEMLEAGK
ncbi:MAG: phosphonate ABC transporter substrate-binding protein [Kiritimatiellia bacterium]